MHRASLAAGLASIRLFGFDSFQGLPESAAEEGEFRPGWYHAGYDLVRQHLSRNGIDWGRTVLVPGWFDQTLEPELAERLGIEKASVIMIDCDLYSSTRTPLTFCAPLIRDRAVIFFDDWPGDGPGSKELGERRALGEFLTTNPDLSAEERGPYPWRVGPRIRRFGRPSSSRVGLQHRPLDEPARSGLPSRLVPSCIGGALNRARGEARLREPQLVLGRRGRYFRSISRSSPNTTARAALPSSRSIAVRRCSSLPGAPELAVRSAESPTSSRKID
jgi:hypothetical protein